MNWLDLFILLFLIAAFVRGLEVGFIRQFFSTFGFLFGIFFGAWLQSLLIYSANTPHTKALLALLVTLGFGLAFMAIGEYVGLVCKFYLRGSPLTNKFDRIFGSVLAAVTLLATVWLAATVFRNVPDTGWQRQIRTSHIVNLLDNNLPSAPSVLTRLGHLIDPNGFPTVFSGLEPRLKTDAPLPDMGDLTAAVQAVRPSIVKIEGEGCGNLVEGSGFIAGNGEVVTNAHVIAGVKDPFVLDQKGRHSSKVILFDPNLDLAILRSNNLAGKPLELGRARASDGTPTAVLGYPANAGFTAKPGVILESFKAEGRNIYNKGDTTRSVYSLKADIHAGNSGGPIIDKNGKVLGVVFAKSINYDQAGYALTAEQVADHVQKAKTLAKEVESGSCTP